MRIIYLVRSYLVRAWACQGVRNISFSENFAKVINEWSHTANVMFKLLDLTQWFPFFLVLSGGSNGRVGRKKINHFKGTFLYVKNHIFMFICIYLFFSCKHGSPFSECVSRYCKTSSLSMHSCYARSHVSTSFALLKKKFNWLGLFFQSHHPTRGQFFGHLVNSYAMFQIREALCCSQMFFKIGALKNFANFTGKQLC